MTFSGICICTHYNRMSDLQGTSILLYTKTFLVCVCVEKFCTPHISEPQLFSGFITQLRPLPYSPLVTGTIKSALAISHLKYEKTGEEGSRNSLIICIHTVLALKQSQTLASHFSNQCERVLSLSLSYKQVHTHTHTASDYSKPLYYKFISNLC